MIDNPTISSLLRQAWTTLVYWADYLRRRHFFACLIVLATFLHLLALWFLSDFSLYHSRVGWQSSLSDGKAETEIVATISPANSPSVGRTDPNNQTTPQVVRAAVASPVVPPKTSSNAKVDSSTNDTSTLAAQIAKARKAAGQTNTGLNRARQISIFNLNVSAQRVVYLIDFSGSMWHKIDTRTRFQVACEQVRQSIEALGPEMQFDVVMFADHAVTFQPQLILADEAGKKAAEDFLAHVPDQEGSTNLIAGLEASISLQPDSVFLLTDGIANMPEWEVFQKVNEMQKTLGTPARLYAIGLVDFPDDDGGRFLQKLTRTNGGSFVPYQLWSQEVN